MIVNEGIIIRGIFFFIYKWNCSNKLIFVIVLFIRNDCEILLNEIKRRNFFLFSELICVLYEL